MTLQRAYATGRFHVELDGSNAGWIWSAEGGQPTTDVVVEKHGSDLYRPKHISTVKYEDLSVVIATGMSRTFWRWVENSFKLDHERRNGAIVAANFDLKETSRLSFYNGLVTELGLPACDAASKDAAKVAVKIVPEYTRFQTSPKGGAKVHGTEDRTVQRRWSPANFRLTIAGIDCTRVNKVEALTVKQKVAQYAIGEQRDYENEPTSIEVPNLVISLPESHASSLFQWHKSFVIEGNCGTSAEKTGSLEFLDPSLKKVLCTVSFYNLGIFKVSPDKLEASSDNIRRVKAEMYCERMEFKFGAGATWD